MFELYLLPSPQISEQVSLFDHEPPVQLNPVSITQLELHPSPSFVLLSSQFSVVALIPSPHTWVGSLIIYGEDPTNELRYILLLGITIFDWPWYAQDNENTKPQQVLYHVAYNE